MQFFLSVTCLPLHAVRSRPSSWQFLINSILAVSAIYCMVKFGISFKMQASAQLGTKLLLKNKQNERKETKIKFSQMITNSLKKFIKLFLQ